MFFFFQCEFSYTVRFQGVGLDIIQIYLPFYLDYQFMTIELFVILLYYPFNVHRVSSNGSFFSFLILLICVYCSFSLVTTARSILILLPFLKRTAFEFDFPCCLLLISLLFTLILFSSVYFRFNVLFFFQVPKKKDQQIIDFRSFLFSNLYIHCYKFPSKHHFCNIAQIW